MQSDYEPDELHSDHAEIPKHTSEALPGPLQSGQQDLHASDKPGGEDSPDIALEPRSPNSPSSNAQLQERRSIACGQANSVPKLDKLTVSQVGCSVPDWLTDPNAVDGAVQLYLNFKPTDATEDVLARLAVGLTNATMGGIERANRAGVKVEVRQLELTLSHKGAAAVVSVVEMLEKHRRSGDQRVTVGSVNIGSGGKAIVGNVQSDRLKKDDE